MLMRCNQWHVCPDTAPCPGRRMFQFTFADGSEVIEEYDASNDTLLGAP